MFAHPIAEVYSELEEVLTRLGVTPFRAEMERASTLALDRASLPVVERAAAAVLAALIAAEAKAPSPGGIAKVQTIVIAAMADRAAQQYVSALREPDRLEPYLDGYGLYRAAAARFARLGSALRTDGLGPALPAIEAVLAALARAYPTATRPASPVPAAPLTQAAERLHQILN
ncbi:hypothetical protein [Roseococcus sp.]|uniref:hypothetical protein n=1 Tax=Roseococcus sp. TaxID=2109646 RepID=UPI003BAB8452